MDAVDEITHPYERLARAIHGAAPHRIARITADLGIEIELATADSARFEADDQTIEAQAVSGVAAAITEIRQMLITEGGET